jgi:hypothetical protein
MDRLAELIKSDLVFKTGLGLITAFFMMLSPYIAIGYNAPVPDDVADFICTVGYWFVWVVGIRFFGYIIIALAEKIARNLLQALAGKKT